jgi:hypothetical protein
MSFQRKLESREISWKKTGFLSPFPDQVEDKFHEDKLCAGMIIIEHFH